MNNEQNKIERIKKSCRFGRIACRVLKTLCIIGAIGAFAGFVLVLIARGQISATGSSPLAADMAIDEGYEILREDWRDIGVFAWLIPESADELLQIALVSLYTAVIAALTALLFHLFGQLFTAVLREESPFTERILKKFRTNFILLTAVILFTTGFGAALVSAFLFWCIFYIFDYGCILQQDADETL